MGTSGWQDLPRPVAFVFTGGATLGALQVGMLTPLDEVGLRPGLVVGTSVGALNGAVLADTGDVGEAAGILDDTWRDLTTASVFPASRAAQAWRLARGDSVNPDTGLRGAVRAALGPAPTFEDLALPFAVVATNVLTGPPGASTAGDVVAPPLASSAIPGLLPTQEINGEPYWDGGVAANVPLLAPPEMSAATARRFLAGADPPSGCELVGAPHTHEDDGADHLVHRPRFQGRA